MNTRIAHFLSLLFVALALGPSLAHLLELPAKMGLDRSEYLTVQQIYRGWALLGIVVLGALLSTLALALVSRKDRRVAPWAVLSLLCVVGAQVVFWSFTFPVNQQTQNWTVLPSNWRHMRAQWEYSHAAGAGLNLIAYVALVIAALARSRGASSNMREAHAPLGL